MVYHLCETHLALEPTIIATHRAFSDSHPVLRLLRQHFTGTIAINDFGRVTLLSDMTAQLDQFLAPGLQGSLQLMQKHFNRVSHTRNDRAHARVHAHATLAFVQPGSRVCPLIEVSTVMILHCG